jgi:hypothetical protein
MRIVRCSMLVVDAGETDASKARVEKLEFKTKYEPWQAGFEFDAFGVVRSCGWTPVGEPFNVAEVNAC